MDIAESEGITGQESVYFRELLVNAKEAALEMALIRRWLTTLAGAFMFFPVGFVLWHGPDADFGLLGGVVLMAFLQFISPYDLWLIPLGAGTVIAFAWHFLAKRNDSHPVR